LLKLKKKKEFLVQKVHANTKHYNKVSPRNISNVPETLPNFFLHFLTFIEQTQPGPVLGARETHSLGGCTAEKSCDPGDQGAEANGSLP
jgi:hypothetical protein